MYKRVQLLSVFICILVSACSKGASDPTFARITPPSTIAPMITVSATHQEIPHEASVYLNNALNIMQTNSVYRKRIDWDNLRTTTYQYAQHAQTPSDTYSAIRFALSQLGDHHSGFLTPDQVTKLKSASVADNPSPRGEILQGKVGYVFLPGFASFNPDQINKFATTVQQIVADVDSQKPCGWIVDLRQDTGGNMWPMLAGIGPILGEGHVGTFVDPDGQESPWYYLNGQARQDQSVIAQVTETPYELKVSSPPVAVLTSHSTASSGEAIVVAFRARPDTRSFGKGTLGLSTANRTFPLSDGAMIALTVSIFADRTGQQYGDVILPDELIDTSSSETDPVISAAIKWLTGQVACITK